MGRSNHYDCNSNIPNLTYLAYNQNENGLQNYLNESLIECHSINRLFDVNASIEAKDSLFAKILTT